MTLKDMDYILEQAGTMTQALENILGFLNESINEIKKNGVMYVDCSNEINFITYEDALEVIECYGEKVSMEQIGKTPFTIIFNVDDKVSCDGESYILGGYLVMKMDLEADDFVPLELADMEDLEEEYGSRLVPFIIGDQRLDVYQF